jgi:hypothetical protein
MLFPFIQRWITRFSVQNNRVLGRWRLEDCYKKIDRKIDYANADHCGPCGHYEFDKSEMMNKINKVSK